MRMIFVAAFAGAAALVLALAPGEALAQKARAGAATHGAGAGAAGASEGGEAGATGAGAAPARVEVGVFVNQITSMSFRDNTFDVDFYVWFRWKGDLDPIETFDVVNGSIESKEGIFRAKRGEVDYASCRVRAKIVKFFDVSHYPLGTHDLAIAIEDNASEAHKLEYIADRLNSAFSHELQIPGWKVVRGEPSVEPYTYRTNYGDPSLPSDSPSTYSRFTYSIHIERPGYGIFMKLFVGLFLSVLLSFLALLIKPTNVDPRFGLGIGAIFAAVSLQFVIESSLPEVDTVTLADKLHKIAYAFIFLTIAESAFSLKLCELDREETSRRLDRLAFVVGLALYSAANVLVVAYR